MRLAVHENATRKQNRMNPTTKKPATEKKEAASTKDAPLSGAPRQYDNSPGGIFFHAGVIIGNKNVFVTNEYLEPMVNALKMAEIKMDIKNLAYVIMPNYFYWLFKMSATKNNVGEVVGEVKKKTAVAIMETLKKEVKQDKPFEIIELFKGNKCVGRSLPQKILWSFEEQAKNFDTNKRYKVWTPKTGLYRMENDEKLREKIAIIKKAPVSERWNLVSVAKNYPYLYLAEELSETGDEQICLQTFLPSFKQAAAVPFKT